METNALMSESHEYREHVFQSLKLAYKGSGIFGVRHFENNRKEIQLIFPDGADLDAELEKLMEVYAGFPEPPMPKTTLHLSVSFNYWREYKSRLAHGASASDFRTIGILPERYVTEEEFKEIIKKRWLEL